MFKDVVDLLQAALSENTRNAFSLGDEESNQLSLVPFVNFFSTWAEKTAQTSHCDLSPDEYVNIKRLLFAAFHDIDRDDDGQVRYDDVVDFLVQQRALTSEIAQEQLFEVTKSYTFQPAAARQHDARNGNRKQPAADRDAGGDLSESDGGDDGDAERDLLFDQAVCIRSLTGGVRSKTNVALVGRSREIGFLNSSMKVVGTVPTHLVSSPILGLDSTSLDDLIVTSHADRTIRVWSEKDSRGLNKSKWHQIYAHECGVAQTAVTSHSRSDRVFSGGVTGEMQMWRFSNDIFNEYRKGERSALRSILVRCWDSGQLHTDAVKAIVNFKKVDRFASCSLDGTAAMFDIPRETVLQKFSGKQGILGMTVCEDFSLLCTVGYDTCPYVWDYTTGLRLPTRLVDAADPHQDTVHSVSVVSNSSTLIATCDVSSKMKIWDLRMMKCVQSITLDREGLEAISAGVGGGGSSAVAASIQVMRKVHQQLIVGMVHTPWATVLATGRKLFSIAERTDVLPKQMGASCAVAASYDSQSGMLVVLHEDSSITLWMNGEKRLTLPNLVEKGETIKTICSFPRGRKIAFVTSHGRVVIFNASTGDVVDSCTAFENKVPVKQVVVGLFEARPFTVCLSADGSLLTWYNSSLPPHAVLPAMTPSCIALGSAEGSLWIGTTDGVVYHLDLANSDCSPPLLDIDPNRPCAITHLTLLKQFGVMAGLSNDGVLFFFNVNYEGELLHRIRAPSPVPKHMASLMIKTTNTFVVKSSSTAPFSSTNKITTCSFEGVVMLGDETGALHTFRVSKKIVHPNEEYRRRFVVPLSQSASLFKGHISCICSLDHWGCFFVASEEGFGKIIDKSCVEIVALSLQVTTWPHDILPFVTNAAHSQRVIAVVHKFLAVLKRKAAVKKGFSHRFLQERRQSTRRMTRLLSFKGTHRSDNDALARSVGLNMSNTFPFDGSIKDSTVFSFPHDEGHAAFRDERIQTPASDNTAELLSRTVVENESSPQRHSQPASQHVSGPQSPLDTRQWEVKPPPSKNNTPPPTSVLASQQVSPSGGSLEVSVRKQHVIRRYKKGTIPIQPAQSEGTLRCTSAAVPDDEVPAARELPGESKIKRKDVALTLRQFCGQMAVVRPPDRRDAPPDPRVCRQSIRCSSARECSMREVLPTAIDVAMKQKQLMEKSISLSVMQCPQPRPPSPLTSRVRRKA